MCHSRSDVTDFKQEVLCEFALEIQAVLLCHAVPKILRKDAADRIARGGRIRRIRPHPGVPIRG